ncbi:MAG: hypothetical protein ACMXYD_03030 [Candidatus Woesearchaeota archaeon]
MREQEVRVLQTITIILLLALSTPLVIATYEENIREGIYLVRPDNEYIQEETIPTYLENEDLTFFACIEEQDTPLRLSILCEDTNEFADIPAYKWGPQNCYIGSINLEQFDCTQAIARAEYVQAEENLQLQQRIRINAFSKTLDRVVETQFSDGGWQGPLDTAYGLLVISKFPDLFEQRIEQAIQYLTLNRDEEDKCWPATNCQTSTTANILYLLNQAGFENLRIQHDGHLYLQREQTYFTQNSRWQARITDHTINLNNTVDTSCVYDYNNNIETFSLERNPETTIRELTPMYEQEISIVCTEPVFIHLHNEFNEQLLSYQGTNFTYSIPPPCWTIGNERITCDVRTTLFAVGTSIAANQKSQASNYLASLLVDDRTAGKNLEENPTTINNALYAQLISTQRQAVIQNLLYYQRNDGSWNNNNTYYPHSYFEATQEERERIPYRVNDSVTHSIVQTGYAIMALENDERHEENLRDAQRYVSLAEEETALNLTDEELTDEETVQAYEEAVASILSDPKRNAMAFYVLKNHARPIIRTTPKILFLDREETTIDLVNPTIFDLENLEYELPNNLQGKLFIEERDFIGAYSFRRIAIRVLDDTEESFGYLRIKINTNEYLKLPIILDQQPELEITIPEEITIFGASATLPFTIEKSDHEFSCSLEWESEGISSNTPFNVHNTQENLYEYPVRFASTQTENRVYEGTITCESGSVTFITPFATNILRFATRPLQVRPATISITDTENY